MNQIELLAPSGSMETLFAAVNGGANAVYLGGKSFGARRSAQNFNNDELIQAVKYCHERNVSVYVTVNTLIKDSEIEDAMAFIAFLYDNDVDAVILQDIGLLSRVRSQFPELHCHASTQMTFHDLEGVRQAKRLGFSRVVLSRELSFDEIKYISENCDVEIEFFVHGALCISYSGQCLMSSFIGGRSGNRGACAQPCRKQYTVKNETTGKESIKAFLMSPKDLMTYEQLDQLKTLNNVSLKIEGRMKGADYVYSIVSTYRDGLDTGFHMENIVNFTRTFNRQFTTGFMFEDSYHQMMNYEIPSSYGVPVAKVLSLKDEQLELKLIDTLNKGDEIQFRQNGDTIGTRTDVILHKAKRVLTGNREETVFVPFKYKVPVGAIMYKTYDKAFIDEMMRNSQIQRAVHSVQFEFNAKIGEYATLKAIFNDELLNPFEYKSENIVELAQKKALEESRIIEQLSKLGGTPYYLTHVSCNIEENMTMPVSELNRMRRLCLEAHAASLAIRYKDRNVQKQLSIQSQIKEVTKSETLKLQLVFNDVSELLRTLENTKDESNAQRNYVVEYYLTDINGFAVNFETLISRKVKPLLPRIIRQQESETIKDFIRKYVSETNLGISISHIGQISYAEETQLMEADYALNVMNSESGRTLNALGFKQVIWSTELSKDELKQLILVPENNGIFAYGHLPLMISEYCPVGGSFLGHDQCKLCLKNQFSLIDERQTVYPLKCNPEHCRVEVMSNQPISLLDQIPMLIKSGFNVFRISIDSYNNESKTVLETIKNLTNINEIDRFFPFNPAMHSRGNFNRGIE